MPEVGKEPPEAEKITPKTIIKKTTNNKNRRVSVQKIVTQIYVFTDTRDKVYTSHVSQSTELLGEMTLEEGMRLARGEKTGGKEAT